MNPGIRKSLFYLLLLALFYMPLFGHLNGLAIRGWDEARVVVNAYEMMKDGDFIVTHYEGEADLWNTKPPLLLWFQVLSMKMFGVNELAVRLPSAFAGLFTCLFLIAFSRKHLKNEWVGIFASLVLISSFGYIDLHSTRSGDYDALLTLFTTVSGLYFFQYMEENRIKYLYLFFITLALAVLTKSVAGLLFVPAFGIYALVHRKVLVLLRSRHFYLGLACFTVLVGGYYGLREMLNPGYLNAVMVNEWGGRYLKVVEAHRAGFWFYLNNLVSYRFTFWIWMIPGGFIFGMISKDIRIKRLTVLLTLMLLFYLLIISTAQTKLEWYDVPMYPLLAVLVAIFVFFLYSWLKETKWIRWPKVRLLISWVFVILLYARPYLVIADKVYLPKEKPQDDYFYSASYYLKDALKGTIDLNDQYLIHDNYHAYTLFYIYVLQEKGVNISIKEIEDLRSGDVIFTHQDHVKAELERQFTLETLSINGHVSTYKILSVRASL